MEMEAKSQQTSEDCRPLANLGSGQSGVVVALGGGRQFESRMVSMGLCPGCLITVLRASHGGCGPVVVGIGATRLALGHGMAEKIYVTTGD